MNKQFPIIVLAVLLGIIVPRDASAQDSPKKILQKIEEIQRQLQNRENQPDQLHKVLNQVQRMETEYLANATDLDPKEMAVLRTLKNPFIHKLPVEQTVIPQQPENTRPTPTNPGPRNPNQPNQPRPAPAQPAQPAADFSVTGIVWNSEHPQAIINGQILSVGEKIDKWDIKGIAKDGVELSSDGKTIKIPPAAPGTSSINPPGGMGTRGAGPDVLFPPQVQRPRSY